MAYPYHYLFSFGGTLPTVGDIWTNNIRFVGSGAAGDEYDEADIVARLMTVMQTRFAGVGSLSLGYSAAVRLEWGKFNQIGPDGRYVSNSVTNYADAPGDGVLGAGSPPTHSPQLALAVSWGTVRQRGPASKGRIYIPMPSLKPGVNGHLSTADALNVAQGWAACIDDLNDVAQNVGQERPIASVVSGVDGSWAPISVVRVGDVIDTQRSRRSALTEIYQTAAVPDSSA